MAIDSTPRSVADATRFTTNNPHAKAKAGSSSSPASSTTSSSTVKTSAASSSKIAPRKPAVGPLGGGGMSSRTPVPETLDERVRRLRAAHLAARNHDVSKMDRVINMSRKYMDAAHRFTVMGLIGFSGLALLVTAYATVDMMVYNRKRREEFFALQKQMQSDSLEAARLAYISGSASEEQITLVEEATAKAKSSGISLPSLLGAPKPTRGHDDAATGAERTVWPGESMTESSLSGAVEEPKEKRSWKDWLFGGLKKEDSVAASLSSRDEEAAASSRTEASGSFMEAVGEQKDALKDKAKAAFDTERGNQRKGGPLDQVGLGSSEKNKSSWW